MKFLTVLLLIITTSFKPINLNNKGCLQLDIIMIIDVSGSVVNNKDFIINAFKNFVDKLELSENTIKLGVITFSKYVKIQSNITSNKNQLYTTIDYMNNSFDGQTTNLTYALTIASNELYNNTRNGIKKVVILISDGDADDKISALNMSTQLKNQYNIDIFGIYINNYSGDNNLMKNISSPSCYMESNYENLLVALEQLDLCM